MAHKASTQLGGIANLALLAPVRSGFIPGADTFTYAKRLEMFFKTLNAIRLASREASLTVNPFPDALGRWGILHSFRYGLIPPEIGSGGEPQGPGDRPSAPLYRLYLNVTFDGGWESYMRVIYRDLGTLLDAIFCNCEGYELTTRCSYDQYCRWVRGQEIPAGIFYTEASRSNADQNYLDRVACAYRETDDLEAARRQVAEFALQPTPSEQQSIGRFLAADAATQRDTVFNNLRALKGLYDLRTFYPEGDDGRTLLNFARAAMPEFGALLQLPAIRNHPGLAPVFGLFPGPIDWLTRPVQAAVAAGGRNPIRTTPAPFTARGIQRGVVSKYDGVTHGCLCLIAISDVALAREALLQPPLWPTTDGDKVAPGDLYRGIALTRQGLALLAPDCIDLLPQEFIDGMEARAGLLGDVRYNHPDHWRRPAYQGSEIDLGSVHIVLQLRFKADDHLDKAELHPKLVPVVRALDDRAKGLRLLSAEPMRSFPEPDRGITREHFGFRDGFSQPAPGGPGPDTVEKGEVFLGQTNDRGGGIYPPQANGKLDNGSFLVIRKIRQHLEVWDEVLRKGAAVRNPAFGDLNKDDQAATMAEVAAKLMGRDQEGRPLAVPTQQPEDNTFDFSADVEGSKCPFQSHVRRSNPRVQGNAKLPRLMRRGMSYGPPRDNGDLGAERGTYFMAYCGSIAEQFETIQRWIAGGNSSGVLSAHSDPMLGVVQPGVRRLYQWWDADRNTLASIDLGSKPLTRVEWGLYAFVPTAAGLKKLAKAPPKPKPAPAGRSAPPTGGPYDRHGEDFKVWKSLLQDRATRDAAWLAVKKKGGQLQTAYGLLVSKPDAVMDILRDGLSDREPLRYSVGGYGRRFHDSVGDGFLGMDPQGGHTEQAVQSKINVAIAGVTEARAYAAAKKFAQDQLQRLAPLPGTPIPVDVAEMTEHVLAALCTEWFGLPDKTHMLVGTTAETAGDPQLSHCPRDFIRVARYVFGVHPSDTETTQGTTRGQALKGSVAAYLQANKGQQLAELSAFIEQALRSKGSEVVAQTIAGVMLGFAPSTHGNFVSLMRALVEERTQLSLWDLQSALLDRRAAQPGADDFELASAVLRAPLLALMRKDPLPATIWRESAVSEPGVYGDDRPKIVVGLHGLMQYDGVDDMMLFGGVQPQVDGRKHLHTVHACPGYGMAMGSLMGIIAAILEAGTLKATPSAVVLKIARRT